MLNIEIHSDYETIYNNIIKQSVDYVRSSGRKSLVLGLSGGVDSTLTCALAREICDILGIKLIGVSLPTKFNKPSEIYIAKLAGEAFCDEFLVYDIHESMQKITDRLTEGKFTAIKDKDVDYAALKKLKIRRGNIAARLRMTFLYDIANENDGMVLSTDNLTELLLGFWTLHGDVGDFGMLQNLWKTEVYGIADYLFVEELSKNHAERAEALFQSAKAVPTDGLGVSKSDMDQIGTEDYAKTDMILLGFLRGDTTKLSHKVIKRHMESAFKRENPYNLPREEIIA